MGIKLFISILTHIIFPFKTTCHVSPNQLPALLQQTGRNRFSKPPFDTHWPGTVRLHKTHLIQENIRYGKSVLVPDLFPHKKQDLLDHLPGLYIRQLHRWNFPDKPDGKYSHNSGAWCIFKGSFSIIC